MNNIKKINQLSKENGQLRESIIPVQNKIRMNEQEIDRLIEEVEKEVREKNADIIKKFEDAGADEFIYIDIEQEDGWRVFEDDGFLHINFGKVRGCFIGSQEMKKSEWNKEARKVLSELNVPKEAWSNLFNR